MTLHARSSLKSFEPVAEALSRLLHPHAEVVIHDLGSGTVSSIFNSFSRRTAGDDSLIEDTDGLASGPEVHGPFEKRLFDGRRIKYVSSLLKNDAGKAVGLLCINLDISLFEQLESVIHGFLGNTGDSTALDRLFEDDWRERINMFISAHLGERYLGRAGLGRTDRRELVGALFSAGGFRPTGSVDYVARVLSVSRATVYNDLGALKASPQVTPAEQK